MDCPRILDLDPNRAVDVDWNTESEGQFYRAVKIRVFCTDESGLLNQMSQVIANSGINIKSLNIRVNAEKKATGIFDLEVKNKDQLRNCLQQLERLTGVISVDRI